MTGTVAGQLTPDLFGERVWTHPLTYCVEDDVLAGDNFTIISTQCGDRSDGCNSDLFRCKLSATLGGNNISNALIDFTLTGWAEFKPGAGDGKVQVDMAFVSGFFQLQGFVQLWRRRPGTMNLYDFTGRQRFVDPSPDPPPQTVLFHDVEAGRYVVVYWDTGGTRQGIGGPEFSQAIDIDRVFMEDVELRVEVIPGENVYTRIEVASRQFVSHRLVGPPGFSVPLIDAATNGKRRKIMWEQRSDQGNIILPGERFPYVTFGEETVPGFEFFFKHYPMMCCEFRTIVQARLVYVGLDHDEWTDYWTERQDYGYGTVVDVRIMELRSLFTPSSTTVPTPGAVALLNTLTSTATVDTLTSFTFERQDILGAAGPTEEDECFDEAHDGSIGMGSDTGDYNTWEDWYADDEFPGEGIADNRWFRMRANFTIHTNNAFEAGFTNDYACAPVGTQWAFDKTRMGPRAAYTSPFAGSATCADDLACEEWVASEFLYRRSTFADVFWDKRQVYDFWDCTNFGCGAADTCLTRESAIYACECAKFSLEFELENCMNVCSNMGANMFEYSGSSAWYPHQVFRQDIIRGKASDLTTGDCNNWELKGTPGTFTGDPCIRALAAGYRTAAMALTTFAESGDPYLQYVLRFPSRSIYHNNNVLPTTAMFHRHPTLQRDPNPSIPADPPLPGTRPWIPAMPLSFDTGTGIYGTFGADTQLSTFKTRMVNGIADPYVQGDNNRFYINTVTPSYARFKVIPKVLFYQFEAATPGTPFDTIDVKFRVTCPLLEHDRPRSTAVGHCADVWRVTNQNNDVILVSVLDGGLRQNIIPAVTYDRGDDLREVLTDAVFHIRVRYTDGDTLVWRFIPKLEPELVAFQSHCEYIGLEIPLPPKQFVIRPMISKVRTAAPACEYSQPEMLASTFRGQFYTFNTLLSINLQQAQSANVQDAENFVHYYEVWDINGRNVEGFSEEFQLFEAGSSVDIYDRFSVLSVSDIEETNLPAEFPNPLIRPVGCTSNGTCPLNQTADGDDVSGINQFHVCTNETNTNQVVLTPRLVFAPPFSQLDNVGSVFFNVTTEFIDVFLEELRFAGIEQFDVEFLVTETSYITLKVRYGRSIDSLLEAPCFERLIDFVIVLTDFRPDPQTLVRIPGCARPDNCCYQLPFVVRGNTPVTTDIVDLTTCAGGGPGGFDACEYEIVTSPAPVLPEGGLCLGVTYDFTFRSPQALVETREPPTLGAFFKYPWRCPVTVTIAIPSEGMSPLDVLLIPGPCNDPGTTAEIVFKITSPSCLGPVSGDNADPDCRAELAFSIQSLDDPGTPFVPGATDVAPYLVQGNQSFAYNLEGIFIFPSSFLPDPDFYLPDGNWRVAFWVRQPGSGDTFDDVAAAEPRNTAQADFLARLENANGLSVVRTELARPLCPGTLADPRPIVISFIAYDLVFEGPYLIEFLTPSGRVIDNRTVTALDFCAPACGLDNDPVTGCPACDILIRDTGIPITFLVGTGVFSPQESGGYRVRVRAIDSACAATYVEFMDSLETLRAQIMCFDTQCPGSRDGVVEVGVEGGTRFPFLDQEFIQGPDLQIFLPLYDFFWNTTEGLRREPSLLGVPAGFYRADIFDANNCTVSVECEVASASSPINLTLVNASMPTCAADFGEVVFEVANGGVPPYTLFKVGPDQSPVPDTGSGGGVILTDTTVVPGVEYLYTVVDANRCRSPLVSFSADPAAPFDVRIGAIRRPCTELDFSGILFADLTPAGTAATFAWFVGSNPVSIGSAQTLNNVGAGVYTVRVVNIFGCTASATFGLSAAGDLRIDTRRTDTETDPGSVSGTIAGGNGPAYVLEVFPPQGIVVAYDPVVTPYRFELRNVPVPWTGELQVTDRGGCIRKFLLPGARTPITITPPNVTDPDVVVEKVGVRKKGLPEGVAWAYLLPVAGVLLAIYIYSGWYTDTWAGEGPADPDRDRPYRMPPGTVSREYTQEQPLLDPNAVFVSYGTAHRHHDNRHLD